MVDKILCTLAFFLIFGGGMCLDSADNTIPYIITFLGGVLIAIEGWRYNHGRF